MDYTSRINSLRKLMEKRRLDAYLTTKAANIYYLSGYRGDTAYLLITLTNAYLYTYPLFMVEAEEQTTNEVKVKIINDATHINSLLLEDTKGLYTLGTEKNNITFQTYSKFFCTLQEKIHLVPDLVSILRQKKEKKEIEFIKKAQQITDTIFEYVIKKLNVQIQNMTELELAGEMEYQMKKLGAEGYSFNTIVASGKNSAIPHAKPQNIKIKSNTNLLMDFGVSYMGYSSDMTRTIYVGKANEEFKKIYNLVLKSQEEAELHVRAGKTAMEIDKVARKIIEDAGYGKQFTHGLGHGVGIEVHEPPKINSRSQEKLEENMIITIEPGIYLKNKFGVRIEDMVIVKKEGFEIMTQSPKELIEI